MLKSFEVAQEIVTARTVMLDVLESVKAERNKTAATAWYCPEQAARYQRARARLPLSNSHDILTAPRTIHVHRLISKCNSVHDSVRCLDLRGHRVHCITCWSVTGWSCRRAILGIHVCLRVALLIAHCRKISTAA